MKISSANITPVSPLTYGRIGRVASAQSAAPSVSVQSSGFLDAITAAAKSSPYGEIRADKVAAAKADIANGRLGSKEDIDATVEAFLRGL